MDRPAGGSAERSAPPWPAGGSASAISSAAFTGSAMPSWWMPTRSAGSCPSLWSFCRPDWRCSWPSDSAWRGCCGPAGPCGSSRSALALTAAEWLRGHILTGFPWNVIGYALTGPLALAQSASLIGIWGLTFVAVAMFASPALLADERAETRRPWLPLLAGLITLAAMFGYGACAARRRAGGDGRGRSAAHHAAEPSAGREVQLWRPAEGHGPLRGAIGPGYRAATRRASTASPISSGRSSAFPFFLTREPDALARIAELLPEGTVLITGGVRPPQTPPGEPIRRAYNSIYIIDHDGSILSIYDKVHLVPFGEYLPFQNLLERFGLIQLTKVAGGFIPGDRRRVMEHSERAAAVAADLLRNNFPGSGRAAGERPAWLINLTNDGWFGKSAGPYQHLRQARVRAIEEGLPLVRAANTGISAVIDAFGRTVRAASSRGGRRD